MYEISQPLDERPAHFGNDSVTRLGRFAQTEAFLKDLTPISWANRPKPSKNSGQIGPAESVLA
jgi:hypothetical protein